MYSSTLCCSILCSWQALKGVQSRIQIFVHSLDMYCLRNANMGAYRLRLDFSESIARYNIGNQVTSAHTYFLQVKVFEAFCMRTYDTSLLSS